MASISLATTMYFIVGGVVRAVRRPADRPARRAHPDRGRRHRRRRLARRCSARSTERWQLYAVYAVFALGFSGAGLIPVTTVVTRWYHARRSVALSVASTGLSAGGIVLTPAAKWLIDDRGLAAATPILGVVWLVGILPFALWFVRPDPAALGWRPTAQRVTADVRRAAPTGVPFHEAVRSRFFIGGDDRLRRSSSAPRSAGSSSSSSSSRTAPTTSTAAIATTRWPARRWSPGWPGAAS